MAAMKSEHHLALLCQLVQRHQASILVWEHEKWHGLAGLRRELTCLGVLEPRDQPIDDIRKLGN